MRQQLLEVGHRRRELPDPRHDVDLEQVVEWIHLFVVRGNVVRAAVLGTILPPLDSGVSLPRQG